MVSSVDEAWPDRHASSRPAAARRVEEWSGGKDFFGLLGSLDAFDGLSLHKGIGTSRDLAPGAPLLPIGTALSMLSEGAVPMVNLMLAFSLGHKLRALKSWRELLGSTAAGISPRTMITLTLGRMVLTPLCHGAVLYGLLGVLPQSRLLRVIVFVEMAPPTASMVVVLSHLANKPRSAQLVAWASIPQYLLGIVTLTLVIAFALAVTEPE